MNKLNASGALGDQRRGTFGLFDRLWPEAHRGGSAVNLAYAHCSRGSEQQEHLPRGLRQPGRTPQIGAFDAGRHGQVVVGCRVHAVGLGPELEQRERVAAGGLDQPGCDVGRDGSRAGT